MMIATPQIVTFGSSRQDEIKPITTSLPAFRSMFMKELLTIPAGTILPGDPELKLASDVFATIDWTSDGIIVASVLLDEDGYGWSYDDAWDDFLASLRDRLNSLARREDRLAQVDRHILDQLRTVLRPKA